MTQGEYAYNLAKELFPICRSITGNGVRQTLSILQAYLPELEIKEVPTGTQCFDWTIPREWNIKDAWVKDKNSRKVIDFTETNLHVMGYSTPVHKIVTLDELMEFVYTEPSQPDVIPYVTSYYKERYGFCISEKQKQQMLRDYTSDDEFEICIDSSLEDGSLTYGELLLPGDTKQEVFFSTYICHPSMANDNVSGPAVAAVLAKHIKQLRQSGELKKYSYRFIFIPETIGAIMYLSRHLNYLKGNMIAGFNLTCVGDDRTYSFVHTRYGGTLADKLLENVLSFHYPDYKAYSFLDRGSDERQYNAPGVDLPICTFCRSLFCNYPEYHTSADDLGLISPSGLQGTFDVMLKCIIALEHNGKYKVNCICEPQLGKRGLYPLISRKGQYAEVMKLKNMIAYFDGRNDLIDVSNIIHVPVDELIGIAKKLQDEGLLTVQDKEI